MIRHLAGSADRVKPASNANHLDQNKPTVVDQSETERSILLDAKGSIASFRPVKTPVNEYKVT